MKTPSALMERPLHLAHAAGDTPVAPIFGGCLVDPSLTEEFSVDVQTETVALDEVLEARCWSL